MAFGFARPPQEPPPESAGPGARSGRLLEPAEWASAGIPLLRNPREVVAGLHARHLPVPATVIVAVLDPQERVVASASSREPSAAPDGWEYRNALLAQLRRIIPHDLRLRVPVRTAVLLSCREGGHRWTEADGAWMWGLRDACTLHGLRCGAFIVLTGDRWQVLGEGRGGRLPRGASSGGRPRNRADGAWSAVRGGPDKEAGRGPGGPAGGGAGGREGVTGPVAAPGPEPRATEGPGVAEERPSGQGPAAPQHAAPARTAAPAEQVRSGRGAPRRAGGGAAEARRHPAAR